MKALKIIGIIVLLVIVAGVAGFMIQSDISVDRSVTIDAPSDMVKTQLTDFEQFVEWDPWSDMDPDVEMTYEGEAGNVGHMYSWSGNENVGRGTMEITEITDNTVSMKLTFMEPWESEATTGYTIESSDEGTTVTWSMQGQMPMLMKMMGAADQVGADFDKGLTSLKERVEAMEMPADIEVSSVDFPEHHFVVARATIPFSEMQSMFENNMEAVYGAVAAAGMEVTTAPSGVYFMWDAENEMTDMGVGVGVANADASVEGYSTEHLGGNGALMVEHIGSYEKLGDAHMAIEAYANANNVNLAGVAIEQYMNDPMEVEESEYITHIYYPIASEEVEIEEEM